MTDATRHLVTAYWDAATDVTFNSSDKDEVYELLGKAEKLIVHLVAELTQSTHESI